jgi:hypothetical protein
MAGAVVGDAIEIGVGSLVERIQELGRPAFADGLRGDEFSDIAGSAL